VPAPWKRWIAGASAALLSGCGLADYIPRGPSLKPAAAQRWLDQGLAPVTYTGEPRFAAPLPPFQVFVLRYVDDIVIETQSPRWSMHEYARIEADGRELWIAKDSDSEGVQVVTADLPDLERWMPEIPVPRRSGAVEVEERSAGDRIDVTLRYPTPAGEDAVVRFAGDRSTKTEKARNGSTFNHSQQVASVILDIPHRQLSGIEAEVSYDGEPSGVRRVMGLIPVAALLDQTQAGFAVASMKLRPDEAGLAVTRPIPGEAWSTRSEESWRWEGDDAGSTGALIYSHETSAWQYTFEGGGLVAVAAGAPAEDGGVAEPLLQVRLSAPLPDLRRPFEGEIARAFVVEMGGAVHGHGWIRCRWEGSEVVARLQPADPSWFAARPLETRVRFTADGAALLRSRRIPQER